MDILTPARVAHHEAAHAVVATLRGTPVRYVSIRPRRHGCAGVTVCRHPKDGAWETYGAILAAGTIADDAQTGVTLRPTFARPVGDLKYLRTMARQVRDETRAGRAPAGRQVTRTASVQAIAKIAWAEAYADLIENYGAVRAVAERLLTSRRTLAGAELREIVVSAPTAEMPHAGQVGAFWPPWFMKGWWTP